MNSILRLSSSFLAALLLLAPSRAHAVRNCPTLREILDQYVHTKSPQGIKVWGQRLNYLINSRAKFDGFLNFSEKEFSSENIHFFVAVRTYRLEYDVLKSSERLALADFIYDKFLTSEIVNLSGSVKDTLKVWRTRKTQSVTQDLFNDAEWDVIQLCNDTLARFQAEVRTNGLGNDKTYKNCK